MLGGMERAPGAMVREATTLRADAAPFAAGRAAAMDAEVARLLDVGTGIDHTDVWARIAALAVEPAPGSVLDYAIRYSPDPRGTKPYYPSGAENMLSMLSQPKYHMRVREEGAVAMLRTLLDDGTSDADQAAAILQLVRRDPRELSHDDWVKLRSLERMSKDRAIAAPAPTRLVLTTKSLIHDALRYHERTFTNRHHAWEIDQLERAFHRWRWKLDPSSVPGELTAAGAAPPGSGPRTMPHAALESYSQLLPAAAALPLPDRVRVGAWLLSGSGPRNAEQGEALLRFLAQATDELPDDTPLAPAVDEARALIDINLRRHVDPAPNTVPYPDFAELGTVRAHLQLIDHVTQRQQAAATA